MQHQRCRRQRSVFRRLQRCCEWCRERRGMCLSVRGTFLSIYTAVPVRLAALPDTLLSTYETNPAPWGPFSPPLYCRGLEYLPPCVEVWIYFY